MPKMKNSLIIVLLILASCNDSVEVKIIKEIEKSVTIGDVKKYNRYYYIENNIVYGTYLVTNEKSKFLMLKKNEIPKVLDGGCDVINVVFDLNTKKIQNQFCNESS